MTTRLLALGVVVLGVLVACQGWVMAQPATAAAAGPATRQIRAQITGVEGTVQVRETSEQPWRPAEVGMEVGEGAEFRTGVRSAVRVLLPPDQTLTLDRLGTVKLLQAIQQGSLVKTRVGMRYGRTRYDIEAAGVEHQSELVSPSSTLAIRGTQVHIFDQPPFAPSAVSLTGRAVYTTAKRQVAFGGKGQGKTEVSSSTDSAAAGALLRTYVDPNTNFGRPESDQKLINQLQAKGDVVVRGGELALAFGPAVTDRQLTDLIAGQGRFNIALRWFGPGDFDLFVLTPDPKTDLPAYTLGNPSYKGSVFKDLGFFGTGGTPPVTAAKTPDGGRIKFDQVAFGGGGIELASWDTPVPQVGYTIALVYFDQSGKIKNYPQRQDFRVDAFLDGKRVPVMVNGDQVVTGTATSLEFGPTYAAKASLVPAEKLFPLLNPNDLNGDIRISAVDLTPLAAYVDGTPIGNINPSSTNVTAQRSLTGKSGKTVANRVGPFNPVPAAAAAPVGPKPAKPAAAKGR